MTSLKFVQLKNDQCVFIRHFVNAKIYLALYVDNGLAMSSSDKAIHLLLSNLKVHFSITVDSGEPFVGLNIAQERTTKKNHIPTEPGQHL